MDPNTAFRQESPDIESGDLLEFPDLIPSDADVVVPSPVVNYPNWTTTPYANVDIPPTFHDLIKLPVATDEPPLYAAAVDTMRATNNYFFQELSQFDSSSLTEAHVQQTLDQWRNTVDEAGNDIRLSPVEVYPVPPDPRTLYVKEAMGDPLDERSRPLWIKACESVANMDDPEWERYTSYTRESLVEAYSKRTENDDSWLILELFKRYLVWYEIVNGISERSSDFAENQPTFAELEDFFERDDIKERGATLVDICHAFPHAGNAEMLVYRISRFADLIQQPSKTTDAGVVEPVESRYMRKHDPTRQGIMVVIRNHLRGPGDSISIGELATWYWPSNANKEMVATVLQKVAQPDLTTGRYILMDDDGPSFKEIEATMVKDDYLSGFTPTDIASKFRDRVWSLDRLGRSLNRIAYLDRDEDRYFPLYRTDKNTLTTREESIRLRNRDRFMVWDSDNVREYFRWDISTRRYAPRLEQLLDVTLQPEATGSPTEVATSAGNSPAPEFSNTLHVPVAAIETVPVEPSELQETPQRGARAIAEVAPLDTPVAATGDPGDADSPLSLDEPGPPRDNRPSKRPATESLEQAGGIKKGRRSPQIRCDGRTQKGTRCKKHKDREPGEEEWSCGIHRRG